MTYAREAQNRCGLFNVFECALLSPPWSKEEKIGYAYHHMLPQSQTVMPRDSITDLELELFGTHGKLLSDRFKLSDAFTPGTLVVPRFNILVFEGKRVRRKIKRYLRRVLKLVNSFFFHFASSELKKCRLCFNYLFLSQSVIFVVLLCRLNLCDLSFYVTFEMLEISVAEERLSQ